MRADEDVRPHGGNLAVAIAFHLGAGSLWQLALGALLPGAVAPIWVISAFVLWLMAVPAMADERSRPGRVWLRSFGWWLSTFAAPIVLALDLVRRVRKRPAEPASTTPRQGEERMSTSLLDRLDSVELRLVRLQREVQLLRADALQQTVTSGAEPVPQAAPEPLQQTVTRTEEPSAAPARPPRYVAPPPPARPPARPPAPPKPPRELDLADLLGARALAWAGGVVTLLGVVFFFVLAVNRGWIGPVERITLGGVASLLVFGAGLAMRARYGRLYSAFASVGAGLAGGYATLLAAAALYELVPDLAALAIAAGIAAVGAWTALRWSSETIAGIGLLGAMLVPVSVVFDGGLTVVGTAFALLMLAATATVSLRRRWDGLLAAAGAASLGQAIWLVLQEGEGASGAVVAVAAAFWLATLAIGVARQLRGRAAELDRLAVSYLLASTAFAGSACSRLLNGELLGASRQGLALVAVAAVVSLVAAALYRRPSGRDLSALLGAAGLTVVAVGFADLLGGQTLAIAWAAQAALLAWLAARIGETRYHAAALAYLGLAAGHALVVDAPLRDLLEETAHPAAGTGALAAVALAALVFGRYARRWEPVAAVGGPIARAVGDAFATFAELRPVWRVAAFSSATVLALYGLGLGILEAFAATGSPDAFDWGHVAVTAAWATAAAAVFLAGLRRRRLDLQNAGLVWLAVTLVKLVGFDSGLLETQRGLSALVVAAAFLVCGIRLERGAAALTAAGGLLVVSSAALAAAGSLTLVAGDLGGLDGHGLALLGLGVLYAQLAAWTFGRTRDLAGLLGLLALLLAFGSSLLLLDGTPLVAAWTTAAAALAWLGRRVEPRLHLPALGLTGLALAWTVLRLAPLSDLLVAGPEPAAGVPALLLCAAAAAALAAFAPRERRDGDAIDRELAAVGERWRDWSLRAAGVVGLYAGSLVLLGLALAAGGHSLDTEFQRGHTAVSAFWGIVGLVALYVGLRRAGSKLRVAGFALFGVSLAKIFLFDLSRLDSVTRALSFLAVGAVLLLAGFFYQRLTSPAGGDSRPQPS
jgi:uncharacterized membrane protein